MLTLRLRELTEYTRKRGYPEQADGIRVAIRFIEQYLNGRALCPDCPWATRCGCSFKEIVSNNPLHSPPCQKGRERKVLEG